MDEILHHLRNPGMMIPAKGSGFPWFMTRHQAPHELLTFERSNRKSSPAQSQGPANRKPGWFSEDLNPQTAGKTQFSICVCVGGGGGVLSRVPILGVGLKGHQRTMLIWGIRTPDVFTPSCRKTTNKYQSPELASSQDWRGDNASRGSEVESHLCVC